MSHNYVWNATMEGPGSLPCREMACVVRCHFFFVTGLSADAKLINF